MILPGLQALLGFQLIAVFNTGFSDRLSSGEQRLHLLALGLIAVAGALVMTPAAYHRHIGPRRVSEQFLTIGSRFLLAAMIPLMIGISLDFYLIARMILHAPVLSAGLAAGLGLLFCFLWLVYPRIKRSREHPP